MKPVIAGDTGMTHWYECGECGAPINPFETECPNCGVVIDWEGGEQE